MKNLIRVRNFWVDHFSLPKTITKLFQDLGYKPDRIGISDLNDDFLPSKNQGQFELTGTDLEVIIFSFESDPDNKNVFKVRYLCDHKEDTYFLMTKEQAASCLIRYLLIFGTQLETRSVWIPFCDKQGDGAFRIFSRKDGSKEIFLYSAKDLSNWASDGVSVAYAKVN